LADVVVFADLNALDFHWPPWPKATMLLAFVENWELVAPIREWVAEAAAQDTV